MDFDQWVVGPFRSVEDGFELCWGYVVEVAVQPAGVVPVDPAQRGQLDIGDGFPRPGSRGPVDQFGLVPFTVSARALSKLSPTVPIDGAAPISARRSPYRSEVNCDPASE